MSNLPVLRPHNVQRALDLWDEGQNTFQIASALFDEAHWDLCERLGTGQRISRNNHRDPSLTEAAVYNSLSLVRAARRRIEERRSRNDAVASRETVA